MTAKADHPTPEAYASPHQEEESMSTDPSPADWLALCLITESNQAHEWPFIAWTVRNRMASKKYPRTVEGVVLAPKQFSHFNAFIGFVGSKAELLEAVLAGKATVGRVKPLSRSLYNLAIGAAVDLLEEPVWRRPFGPTVCHYWSPISMRPRNGRPAWAPQAKRLFTPSGIDPERFVYADGVP
jgi:hypothetical protein